jgi:hypothetical protein
VSAAVTRNGVFRLGGEFQHVMKVGCRSFVGTPGRTPTVCLIGRSAVQGFNTSTLLLAPSVLFLSFLVDSQLQYHVYVMYDGWALNVNVTE